MTSSLHMSHVSIFCQNIDACVSKIEKKNETLNKGREQPAPSAETRACGTLAETQVLLGPSSPPEPPTNCSVSTDKRPLTSSANPTGQTRKSSLQVQERVLLSCGVCLANPRHQPVQLPVKRHQPTSILTREQRESHLRSGNGKPCH